MPTSLIADRSLLQQFQKAYRNTNLTLFIDHKLRELFWVPCKLEALEELKQFVEDCCIVGKNILVR